MNESKRLDGLAGAVEILAGAVETVASKQGDLDATNDAQVARETAQRLRGCVVLMP